MGGCAFASCSPNMLVIIIWYHSNEKLKQLKNEHLFVSKAPVVSCEPDLPKCKAAYIIMWTSHVFIMRQGVICKDKSRNKLSISEEFGTLEEELDRGVAQEGQEEVLTMRQPNKFPISEELVVLSIAKKA